MRHVGVHHGDVAQKNADVAQNSGSHGYAHGHGSGNERGGGHGHDNGGGEDYSRGGGDGGDGDGYAPGGGHGNAGGADARSAAAVDARGRASEGGRRRVWVVGIGSGGLDQITVEAVHALQAADYALAAVKSAPAGAEGLPTDPLFARREVLLGRHAPNVELVGVPDPERERSSSSTSTHGDYRGVVLDWHEARAAAWEQAMAERPGDVAIPVWGDPAFYDSTLRILERIRERGRLDLDVQVLPGISALQVLAARHRLVLHEIGGTVTVTTGRRLQEVVAGGVDNVLVMLNSDLPIDDLADWHIWWGGNLGDAGETVVAGRVGDVLPELRAHREWLRDEHGWVMDIYLLRRDG